MDAEYLDEILVWESTKLHKVEGDRGGWTMYGISQRLLSRLRESSPSLELPDSVADLTFHQAATITEVVFWRPMNLDKIAYNDERIALQMLDFAFNTGNTRVPVKHLQRAMNRVLKTRLTVDGVLGPKTTRAFKRIWDRRDHECEYFLRRVRGLMRAYRCLYYYGLAKDDPSLVKFEDGWLIRAQLVADDYF